MSPEEREKYLEDKRLEQERKAKERAAARALAAEKIRLEREAAEKNDSDESEGRGQTCYETLGIEADATRGDINRAYRVLMNKYHPDRVAALGPKLIAVAEREAKLLNAAREEALSQCPS